MSQSIMNTAKTLRMVVLGQLQAIPEELFDHQPEGFSNTIRWNVGHIICNLDSFLSIGLPFNSNLPKVYGELFPTGTRPSNWTIAPPSKEELIHYISAQLNLLSEIAPDALDEKLPSPFEMGPLQFRTVGEVVNFALIHESIHLGIIKSLFTVIQYKK